MLHIPIVHAHDVSKQIHRENFPWGWKCYKTIDSYVICAFVEIWSTWEVWRALKKLGLLSATPRATLTHLSCSPNFLRALYLDERTLTYEPIVNYLALSSISSISFLSFFLLLSRFWSFRYQHLVNFMRMVLRTKPLTLNVILMPLRNHKDRVLKLI